MQHRFVGGDEHFGNRRGVHIVELRRNRHGHAVVDARQFGVGAAADDAHHPVADGESTHLAAGLDHFPGNLQTDDQRVAEVRMAVAAGSVGQVGTVHAGRIDTHHQVGLAHFRFWRFT
ncbi:hypothetical protein PS876_05257 [Pseudomonas fluorescens]|nr:hypothetical protein PS876_05257 [Pseudomonas fluorescens]